MLQPRLILFVALSILAIACGCAGQSAFGPYGNANEPVTVHHKHHVLQPIRTLFVVVALGRKTPIREWWGWIDPKTHRPVRHQEKLKPLITFTPEPTPSPGFGAPCTGGYEPEPVCFYLNNGQSVAESITCGNCPPSPNISAVFESSLASFTPPPGFSVEGETSLNQNQVNCTSGCTMTMCPTTSCWAEVIFEPQPGTPPANINNEFCLISCSVAPCLLNYITTLPTVQDEDIASGSQTVSWNGSGVLPSPIMVGQQVQLQASPSSVTGVQWAFDYTTATSVVANSSVGNNQSVGTPSPVQSSGNPNSFYWVSTVGTIGNGLRYVRMSGSVSGVTGPLFADVYYPIGGPSASISFTTAAVQDSNATFGNPNDFPVGCPTPWVTYYAMHLGGSCGSPQPTPGILTNYSVGIPSYGAGELAIAQLLTLVFTGTKSTGTPVPQYTVGPNPNLDASFPYAMATAPTSTGLSDNDSPALRLDDRTCSKVVYSENFTDYFMYEPNATTSRPSIWVTDAVGQWTWGGTSTEKTQTNWTLSSPQNPSPSVTPSTTLPSWPNTFPNPSSSPLPC
jgi:hypothetical protein